MTASSPTTTAPAAETHDHSHGSARWELWFAIAAGVTYAGGMIAEFALGLPMVGWPLVFFLATYFFGGFFTFRTAIASTMRGKFEVDFLMLVAAIGAALIGRWAEGAVLLFLFSLGHALEGYAMGRARRAIEALAVVYDAAWAAAPSWNSTSAARKPSRKITKMMMSNSELTSPKTIM